MGIREKRATNLREKFMKRDEEEKSKKSGKGDKRFLNYYDLDFGEKMTIRLLPDGGDSGEYYLEYATHGPNLKTRGVTGIACSYTSSGEDCSVCAKSFDHHSDGDKDEAFKWRRKETFIGQCLVIDSPIEINETEDVNPVKLVYLPWGMVDVIKEAITEGQVENPMDVDFIIKKTKNKGNRAEYGKSYFANSVEPLDDDILDAFDNGEMNLYDLSEELPAATTSEEMEEWLEKTIKIVDKNSKRGNRSGSDNDSDDDSDNDSDNDSADDPDDDSDNDSTTVKKTSASDLMNRLKNKKKKD